MCNGAGLGDWRGYNAGPKEGVEQPALQGLCTVRRQDVTAVKSNLPKAAASCGSGCAPRSVETSWWTPRWTTRCWYLQQRENLPNRPDPSVLHRLQRGSLKQMFRPWQLRQSRLRQP
jgi:hypothetical protein